MLKKVEYYNFEKIWGDMNKRFGTIPKSHENRYNAIFSTIDGNMLKIFRENKKINGRRILEAIYISLYTIDGYLKSDTYDFTKVMDEDTEMLARAILTSFDPFTNSEVKDIIESKFDLSSQEALASYFEIYIKCLVRMKKSVEFWSTDDPCGYFYMLESEIGDIVPDDMKMDFFIYA